MSQIRAFIGHSFTDGDEQVVGAFLKFFDRVQAMNIGFAWEHAEGAEPKELADKVLSLIKDKNLFIGICTKKEFVISPAEVRKGLFGLFCKKQICADESLFATKTSDWIVQEIGLAIGRGMELILLVEQGLRPPGGLQGNREFISFERHAPERAFGKILEMIQALRPTARNVIREEQEITTALPPSEPEKQSDDEWYQPRPDWRLADYELAFMHALVTENEEQADSVSDSYFATMEGATDEARAAWKAVCEYKRLQWGKNGDFLKLHELANAHPANCQVQRYLAKGYEQYQDYEKAAHLFQQAADKCADVVLQLNLYGDAALAFTRAGQEPKANIAFARMRQILPSVKDGESILLRTVRAYSEHIDDVDLQLGVIERTLQLHPEDSSARFSLALKHSEAGNADVSLLHYLRIPFQERVAATWNNLGVQFDNLGLQTKSVVAYRRAEELGETLAMSNLAQKFITAGFLREAEDICNKALKFDNYHKNVGYAISRIKDVPQEEDKKEGETITSAKPLSDFYAKYGCAACKNALPNIAGRWRGEECTLQLEIADSVLVAEGTYEKTFSNTIALAIGGRYGAQDVRPTTYRIRYEGAVKGFSIKGKVRTDEENKPQRASSLLLDAHNFRNVLMVVSDDLSEITVLEKGTPGSNRCYLLKRQ